jgi:hypothetical protein
MAIALKRLNGGALLCDIFLKNGDAVSWLCRHRPSPARDYQLSWRQPVGMSVAG